MVRQASICAAIRLPASFRRGVTLVELLVVIALLVMITAVTVPAVAPSIRQRRQREAARLVSSYIAGVRSRAIETGRPAAVVIERFNPGLASTTGTTSQAVPSIAQTVAAQQAAGTANLQPFSMYLSTAESPPPYSGDFTGSVVDVTAPPTNSLNKPDQWPPGPSTTFGQSYPSQVTMVLRGTIQDNWQAQNIRVGDGIRFNYQGPIYYFDNYNTNTNGLITLPTPYVAPSYVYYGPSDPRNNPDTSPPQFWSAGLMADANAANGGLGVQTVAPPTFVNGGGVPYQIFRQPVSASAVAPLQLPEGIVIDIEASGVGPLGTFSSSTTSSPIISFNPDGTVHLVYDGLPRRPIGTIFLLIGRREQVPLAVAGYNPPTANLNDPSSLWITINSQTGQVATFENYVPSGGGSNISAYGSGGSLAGADSGFTVNGQTYYVGVPRTHASGSYTANYAITTTGGN